MSNESNYIYKEELEGWKNHPTTLKLKGLVDKLVAQGRQEAAKNMGKDSHNDRYYSGLFNGIELAWQLDDLIEVRSEQ